MIPAHSALLLQQLSITGPTRCMSHKDLMYIIRVMTVHNRSPPPSPKGTGVDGLVFCLGLRLMII